MGDDLHGGEGGGKDRQNEQDGDFHFVSMLCCLTISCFTAIRVKDGDIVLLLMFDGSVLVVS
jgi:hypothetical protein